MKSFIAAIICLAAIGFADAQSYGFGFKGGPTLGLQQWNGLDGRDPLIRYHGTIFVESHSEESKGAIWAQAGYHIKGSALRTRRYFDPFTMQNRSATVSNMTFQNVSLSAGVKQKFPLGAMRGYYLLGIRGEHTLDMQADGFLRAFEGLQENFVFGLSVGGGIEVPFGQFISGVVELSAHPDISKQIRILPQDTGYTDQNGVPIILPAQEISNFALELSIGLRFLHEITYID